MRKTILGATLLIASLAPAAAYNDVFIGEVHAFAGSYCPHTWMPADGRELKIDDNRPLFALLGIAYGGDGHKTFALPDLRSKAPAQLGKDDKGHRFKLQWCVKVKDGQFQSGPE
ncbi:MAG: tail fiber protein [Alphaproteobacteria bacterium]|nr:tail fiber protein [Alphaproteobacteria bacterium]